MSLSGMAWALHELGNREQAQARFEEALKLYRKIGDKGKAQWVLDFIEKENYLIPAK